MSQVWLITGASRGLGRALTEAALAAGHRVLATARNPKHLVGIANKFEQSVRTVSLDATDENQAQNAVDTAIRAFGRVDVLVNNEGFSESLSKEVRPLGVRVTIVEPGGFRTDFAGSSTKLRAGRPDYEATVGATVRFQRDYNGKQPGDPAKAAAALLHIASLPEPPLRLLLGSDAYDAAQRHASEILASDREWKALTTSTDFS